MRIYPKTHTSMFDFDDHSDMIKSCKISADGMVCVSISSDGTLRVWDIGLRKCVKVYGDSRKQKLNYPFHKDSIWCLEVS